MGAIREIVIRQGEMSGKILQPDANGSWVAALMLGDGYVDWLPFSGSGGFTVNYNRLLGVGVGATPQEAGRNALSAFKDLKTLAATMSFAQVEKAIEGWTDGFPNGNVIEARCED